MFKELFTESTKFEGSEFDFKRKNKKELDALWAGPKEDLAKSPLLKEFLLRGYLSIETYIDGAEQMFKDKYKIKTLVDFILTKNFNKIDSKKLIKEFDGSNASNDRSKKFTQSIKYEIDGNKISGSFELLGKKYKGATSI